MSSPSEKFPELTTTRCLLREILPSDQPKIFEGLSHPEVIRYYGVSYDSLEATSAQMKFYRRLRETGTGTWWAACLKESGEFIGACGINNLSRLHRKAELGFWLLPAYQRRGYMGEIVPQVIAYGFGEMNLHRIEAIVEPGNEASRRLLLALGFGYEGTQRESEIKNGRFIDLEFYALLRNKE